MNYSTHLARFISRLIRNYMDYWDDQLSNTGKIGIVRAWPVALYFRPTISRPSAGVSATKEFNMRKFVMAAVGAALLVPAVPATATPLQTRPLPQIDQAYPNESYAQYYRRGYRPYYRPYYRDRYYYRRDNGAAVAAGVAGLAAGALIAGAIANQAQAQPAAPPPPGTVDPQLAAYCARKYRSYDPATGTFLATNGMRYVCTY